MLYIGLNKSSWLILIKIKHPTLLFWFLLLLLLFILLYFGKYFVQESVDFSVHSFGLR